MKVAGEVLGDVLLLGAGDERAEALDMETEVVGKTGEYEKPTIRLVLESPGDFIHLATRGLYAIAAIMQPFRLTWFALSADANDLRTLRCPRRNGQLSTRSSASWT